MLTQVRVDLADTPADTVVGEQDTLDGPDRQVTAARQEMREVDGFPAGRRREFRHPYRRPGGPVSRARTRPSGYSSTT